MADLEHKNDNTVVLNAADQAVVIDPISPQASQVSAQRLAKASRVVRPSNPFTQIPQDGFLNCGIEFAQLTPSAIIEFDRPDLRSGRITF
jgi:hypothetical protein